MPAALKDRPKRARLTKVVVEKLEDKEVQEFAWNGMRRFLTAEQAAELVLRPMGVAPEGCHQLECAEGPYNEWGKWEKPKSGGVKWFMECAKCGKKAGESSRWGALMRTACDAPVLGWNQERQEMEIMVDSSLHECRRCGLQCPHGHVGTASRAGCPVHVATLAGTPREEATRWQRKWVAIQGLWGKAAYGQEGGEVHPLAGAPASLQPVQGNIPPPPLLPPVRGPEREEGRDGDAPGGAAVGWNRLLRYNSHMAVDLVGGLVCLRCGDTAGRAALRQRWLGAPCREELRPAAMPRRVIAALNLQPNEWRSRLSPPKAARVTALLDSEVGGATGTVGRAGVLRWQHRGM